MKIIDATFCVVDTETTGLDPEVDELLEIGAILVDWRGRPCFGAPTLDALIKPINPLRPDNSAIHGFIDEDLADAPSLAHAAERFRRFLCDEFGSRVHCLVAHHMQFDAGFLPTTLDLTPSLCTKRLAMHLVPEAPNWKNQTLRYFFRDVARHPDIRALGDAHRALPDVTVTAAICSSTCGSANTTASRSRKLTLAI
jgi:exodeoxyribonuclease X